ncbi:DUF1284 domain-containing protein [Calderihabitans maritimus]|uniref:Iron-sulfur binding protein n=1 Tax=Calderihabitans maritimus TaxID=1246530 RepID=A0A1Z5HTL6_9FIRM|nr:DUF1284 domain-containing protein [Calderihabitans maritimus]GAW92886.1 hypothetical protein Teth39_0291 [Calderihabitans maritimus]
MRLRAHHLLCLQGFRGLGYDERFVLVTQEVLEILRINPSLHVKLVDEPDILCAACPHHRRGLCTRNGPNTEERVRWQDREILKLLGLENGCEATFSWLLKTVGNKIASNDLDRLCTNCQWYSLGYCWEGIASLRDQA